MKKLNEDINRLRGLMNLSESPSMSSSLGGKNITIPASNSHKGQSGWQSANAWDIKMNIGDPVYSVSDGTLKTFNDYGPKRKSVGGKTLFGVGFTVDSAGGLPDVYYTHLMNSQVKKGDKVKCGQLLGFVMDFPDSDYDHLHIGVEDNNIKRFIDNNGNLFCAKGKKLSSTDVKVSKTNSGVEGENTKTDSEVSTPTDDIETNFIKSLGSSLGLKEEKIYSEFGKDKVLTSGTIKLPKNSNSQIKSPVDGIVNNKKDSGTSCVNKIVIQHLIKDKKYYLEFCNVTNPSVSDGEKVRKGKIIGTTNDDVYISLYNSTYDRVSITKYLNVDKDDDKDKDEDKEKEYKKSKTYKDPLMAALIQAPFKLLNPFKDKYDKKTGERIEKRWGSPTEKEQPSKGWLSKMSPTHKEKEVDKEDEKINENIERIKKLLK